MAGLLSAMQKTSSFWGQCLQTLLSGAVGSVPALGAYLAGLPNPLRTNGKPGLKRVSIGLGFSLNSPCISLRYSLHLELALDYPNSRLECLLERLEALFGSRPKESLKAIKNIL